MKTKRTNTRRELSAGLTKKGNCVVNYTATLFFSKNTWFTFTLSNDFTLLFTVFYRTMANCSELTLSSCSISNEYKPSDKSATEIIWSVTFSSKLPTETTCPSELIIR